MQFCDAHWWLLKEEIADRGLSDLVAASGQEVALRLSSGGFDPLMGAHNVILMELVRVAGPGLMTIDGCPVCEGNKAHDEGCLDSTCRPDWYDAWLAHAAEDALTEARRRGLVPTHTGSEEPRGEHHA